MKPPIIDEIDLELERLQHRIQVLADIYRADVLIPLCRKHRLTFVSGMGRTVFYKGKMSIGDYYDAELAKMRYLKPVFEVINKEVLSGTDVFGFYVADVTKDDIK